MACSQLGGGARRGVCLEVVSSDRIESKNQIPSSDGVKNPKLSLAMVLESDENSEGSVVDVGTEKVGA
jgi:hypothetical protein